MVILVLSTVSLVYAPPAGWRSEVIITDDNQHPYGHCCIATDNAGRIHSIMRKLETGEPRCFDLDYYRSLNTGLNWSQILLGAPGGTAGVDYRSTDITTSGNEVMIVFQHADASVVKFLRSTNGGSDWGSAISISSGRHPRLAVDNGYLHSFYAREYAAGNYEIFRKQSTNGGGNWSAEQRLTDAIRNSWHPAVSVNAGAIHLV